MATAGYSAIYIPPVAPHHLSQAADSSRSKSTPYIDMPNGPYHNLAPTVNQTSLSPNPSSSPNLPPQQSTPQLQMPAGPYHSSSPGATSQPDLNSNTSYQPYRSEAHVTTNTPMVMPIPQAPHQTGLAQDYYNQTDVSLPVPEVQVNSQSLPDGPAGERGLFSSSPNGSSKSKKYMDKSAKFIGKQIEKQIQKKMNKTGGSGGAGSDFMNTMQEQFGGGNGDGQQYGDAAAQDYGAASQDYGAAAQDYGGASEGYGFGGAEEYGYPEGCGFDSAEAGEAFAGIGEGAGEAAGGLSDLLSAFEG